MGRAPRADACRNRDRLLEVASDAFSLWGTSASLEKIAKEAGVGIGTLYRHFPTREALVEAVYAAELDAIALSSRALLEELPPDRALRAWMDRYGQFAAVKRGMVDTLRAGWAAGRIATPSTRERVTGAIAAILGAGAEAGSLRPDVDPDDVTAMLLGVFLSTAGSDSREQTGRLLDLLVDALRTGPAGA
jgi:AcrR family transcriptional regulator